MDRIGVITYFMYIAMIITIMILLYISMRRTGINEIKFLILGFFGIMFSMIQYTGIVFFEGEQNENLTQRIFSISGYISVLWGWNLLLFGLRLVTESKIPKRYYIYLINNSILVPLIFAYSIDVQWDGDKWDILYTMPGGAVLVGLGIFSLVYETTVLLASVSKYSGIDSIRKLFIIYTVFIFASIPIFALRKIFGLPLHFYLLPVNFAFLTFAIIIYYHPEVFQTSHITPQFLLILQVESGVVLKMYHFVDNSLASVNSTLMASALTALQYMFQDLSNKDTKIHYIGLPDTHLSFCYSDRYLFILGSQRKSLTLSSILSKIQRSWVREVQFLFSEEDEAALDELVTKAFIYQINRLNLLIKSEGPKVTFR